MNYKVGIIGSGSISASHSYAFDKINENRCDIQLEKTVMCSRNVTLERASELGWNEVEKDWRKVIDRGDIDVIDICAYDVLHYPIVKAAIENGKMIICEKPLSDTYEQALELACLADKKNINAVICTNYRYMHAVRCIKHLVEGGRLGEIRHVYGSFTMDWAVNVNDGMNWRLDHRTSPGGTLGDLGTHLIDMCRFINLEFSEVCGMNEVYGKRRIKDNELTETTANELSVFSARFSNGALGVFEFSRISGGGNGMIFEVHGTKGNVRWEKNKMNQLMTAFDGEWKYTPIDAGDILPCDYGFDHEFMQKDSFVLLFRDFFMQNKKAPTLYDGAECCRIVDSVIKSDQDKAYVHII